MNDAPSGPNRGTGDQTQVSLHQSIVKGLYKQPEYLLVFGIALLFGLGGTASFGKALTSNDILWGLLGFASFLVAMVAAVLVINIVRKGAKQKASTSGSTGAVPAARRQPQADDLSTEGLWEPLILGHVRDSLDQAKENAAIISVFDYNCLGPLHSGYELLYTALQKGAELRFMFLDPTQEGFDEQALKENDRVGRLSHELLASLHILADLDRRLLSQHAANASNGRITIKFAVDIPSHAYIIVNERSDHGLVLANKLPELTGHRGLANKWQMYRRDKKVAKDFPTHVAAFDSRFEKATLVELAADFDKKPPKWPVTRRDQ